MAEKSARKLVLHKETLRLLNDGELKEVHGGGTTSACTEVPACTGLFCTLSDEVCTIMVCTLEIFKCKPD